MQKITPYLWFKDGKSMEEAVNLYTSLFKNSRIENMVRYPEGIPGVGGTVMTGVFYLEGQEFMVLNGGPQFTFNESISFFVKCKDQAEVDHFWNRLTANGGEESMCGWLKDKFGVSWQIIPDALGELMGDKDPEKSGRVMQAMLKMKKIIVADLEKAYRGESALRIGS